MLCFSGVSWCPKWLFSCFNKNTLRIYHLHLHLPNNQCAEEVKAIVIGNHFRLKQNKNTSRKLTFDRIFDPLTDLAGCVRLILIQG